MLCPPANNNMLEPIEKSVALVDFAPRDALFNKPICSFFLPPVEAAGFRFSSMPPWRIAVSITPMHSPRTICRSTERIDPPPDSFPNSPHRPYIRLDCIFKKKGEAGYPLWPNRLNKAAQGILSLKAAKIIFCKNRRKMNQSNIMDRRTNLGGIGIALQAIFKVDFCPAFPQILNQVAHRRR